MILLEVTSNIEANGKAVERKVIVEFDIEKMAFVKRIVDTVEENGEVMVNERVQVKKLTI